MRYVNGTPILARMKNGQAVRYRFKDGEKVHAHFPEEDSLTILDGIREPVFDNLTQGMAWPNMAIGERMNGRMLGNELYNRAGPCYQFRTTGGSGVIVTEKPNQASYTIVMHCDFPSFTTTYYPICVGSANAWPEPEGSVLLEVSQANGFRFRFRRLSTYPTSAWSATPLVANKKYNIVMVIDGTIFKLYVDGILKVTYSYPTYSINWSNFAYTFFGSNGGYREYPSNINIYGAMVYLSAFDADKVVNINKKNILAFGK